MHFGPLCMQLRAPISFFLLFGTNSSPEKVQHLLVSPNSIKIAPNGLLSVKKILAVINATYAVAKRKPEKKINLALFL